MKVIIAGAGIGGLTTALSLREAGIDCRVFEATPRVTGLGLGINLQPNAIRELSELCLGDALASHAAPIEALSFFNRHGQRIWSEPRGLAGGFRWPQYAINRGTLQTLLHDAVRARLGEGSVATGHALADFEQDDAGVIAHFVDPATGARVHSERGDVLIGADGLHSAVRSFYPRQPLTFAGQMMWRSTYVGAPFLDGRTMIMAGHRNQKIVAYPMAHLPDGRVVVNWIAELGRAGEASPREEWNRRVDKALFAGRFSTWRFDWLDVPAIIEEAEAVFEFPKVDRDPVPRWTFGRVTMLGDAAHPMQPVGSQAGSQAIIDARAIAFHLAKVADPAAALLRYESERLPLMRDIALQNRAMGAEAVLDIAEERAPQGFADVDEVLSQAERAERSAAYRRLAGLSVESVNAGSQYSMR